ncbi:hypothetical protein EXIGLDRAFT_253893 [Exidia glandulosa HHB12029]|uniref:Uncharacterized protein n=1 Tax=Exidia glandulosa HHB12029 TaxID=1314781 RepID=A0A165DXA0_EXIGL|nr:hypothetical protein EXIGLDRAFT_253893 [Exidia glandulosa HHB12029]
MPTPLNNTFPVDTQRLAYAQYLSLGTTGRSSSRPAQGSGCRARPPLEPAASTRLRTCPPQTRAPLRFTRSRAKLRTCPVQQRTWISCTTTWRAFRCWRLTARLLISCMLRCRLSRLCNWATVKMSWRGVLARRTVTTSG